MILPLRSEEVRKESASSLSPAVIVLLHLELCSVRECLSDSLCAPCVHPVCTLW